MEIIFKSAKGFQKCISAISALIDEGEFFLSQDGLKLRAMDPSQIAMVDFLYPRNAFESASSDEEKFGVNMSDFEKIMKRAKPDEKLILKAKEGELIITFKGKTTRKFTLPLMDLGGALPREPKIPFDATVKVYADFIKESLKDASLVSSHVILQATKDAFYIEAKGDKGEVNIVAEKKQDVIAELDVKDTARAMFPLGYLNDLVSPADSSTIIDVYLKTDAPLKIAYKIEDGEVSYYVAPRIEAA